MLVEILIGIIGIMLIIVWFVQKRLRFWENRGIPVYRKDNKYKDMILTALGQLSFPEQVVEQYNGIPDKLVYGIYSFNIPMLLIKDPDILKQIMIKDFDHFTDHVDSFFKDDIDPFFSKNLFALKGKRWHSMRSILSPAFTGSKMRNMFELMRECGEQIVQHFNKEIIQIKVNKKPLEIEFEDTCTRFTNDVISTVAFGVKIDSLENPNNEIYKMGQVAQNLKIWRFMLITFSPYLSKVFNIRFLPSWVYNYFESLIRDTIQMREENNIVRPDMIHLLTEARKGQLKYDSNTEKNEGIAVSDETTILKPENYKMVLTEEDIIAQAFVFFIAGFGNVALTMAWASYELAANPDIQKKLYKEIKESFKEGSGKLTYDEIMKMKYLDLVVTETLRKWPPLPLNNRQVTKPYTLNTRDGQIDLEPGNYLGIPIMGLHRDPKYFPNPDKFDPERFNDPNKIYPFTYMPFGAGPRLCIGSRLTILEVKVFLAYMLSAFEFVTTKKTLIPPVLKKGTNLQMQGGFWIGLKPRN